MKRFITAMLFSLTVIVCQQQTLFAAAIDEALRNCVAVGADPDRVAILDNFCWGTVSYQSNVASVTADSEEGHRGIPIAGVDRLVPLAGTGDSLIAIIAIAAPQVDEVANDIAGNFRGCIPADDDPNFILDDMPFLELDSPLLPWHGR